MTRTRWHQVGSWIVVELTALGAAAIATFLFYLVCGWWFAFDGTPAATFAVWWVTAARLSRELHDKARELEED